MQQTNSSKPQSAVLDSRDGWENIPLYVREKQIRSEIIPVSHGALWDWVAKGIFPAPSRLTSGVTAWKRSDIKVWAEGNWTPPLGAD
jgi:prophage regulatory protein